MEFSRKVCLCLAIVDSLLFLTIIFGNVLTILAVKLTRRLRNMTSNHFILSLAISDLLVGLTMPYRLAFYTSDFLSKYKITCLLRFMLICFTCFASICNITAIAIDRYVAIVHPLKYAKFMTKKMAFIIILIGWIFSFTVAIVPFYWNKYHAGMICQIENVVPRLYAILVLSPSLIIMWFIIILTYWRIGKEAKMSVQKLKVNNMDINIISDKKGIQVVLLILICFSICWLPFSVVAFMRIYHWNTKSISIWYEILFSFVLANSGMNPLIYAWKNTKFRRTFHRLLHCQLPDKLSYLNSSRNYAQKRNKVATIESQENNSTLPKNVLQTVSDLYSLRNK